MSYYNDYGRHPQFDERDAELLAKRVHERDAITSPRIGDYIRFPSGELERFSSGWVDGLQTSPGGSFYLCHNGAASFSGSLNPSTPRDKITLTSETLPGSFWFFHHDLPGAGRGVYFDIPCRVYTTTADYTGFITR